jgi:hypothetical protein
MRMIAVPLLFFERRDGDGGAVGPEMSANRGEIAELSRLLGFKGTNAELLRAGKRPSFAPLLPIA